MARMPVMSNIQCSKRLNYQGDIWTSEMRVKTSRELLTKHWNKVNYRHWGSNIFAPNSGSGFGEVEPTQMTMRTVVRK